MTPPPHSSPARPRERGVVASLAIMSGKLLAWPVCGLAGLLVATSFSFLIAQGVYLRNKEQYPDYRTRERARDAGMVISHLRNPAARQGDLWGIEMGVATVEVARAGARRFLPSRDGTWRSQTTENVRAIVQQRPDGAVTRYHLALRGLDDGMVENSQLLLRGAIGDPDATAGALDLPRSYRTTVWRHPDRLVTVEYDPDGLGGWTMRLNAIHRTDPRFELRWERGGLHAAHRDVEAIRDALRESDAEPELDPDATPPGGLMPENPFAPREGITVPLEEVRRLIDDGRMEEPQALR